jgi:hypothetical protein
MFDLERAIAQWRRQMLAAGIKTPVPLDELESHLREDVEGQMHSGSSIEQAFETAARRIGQANLLKAEFVKAKVFFGFLGDNRSTKTHHILGMLWLAGCSVSFSTCVGNLIHAIPPGASADATLFLINALVTFIYAVGMIGSVFLFRGAKWGRSIVRMIALLLAVACIAQVLNFRMLAVWRVWCGIVAIFSLVTLWLLHVSQETNLNPDLAAK